MSIKDIISSFFTYTPTNKQTYNFNLIEDTNTKNYTDNDLTGKENKETKIFPSVSVNSEYLKTKYNLLINSDIKYYLQNLFSLLQILQPLILHLGFQVLHLFLTNKFH